MDKLQMAHEMALELVKIKPDLLAWQIADRCFEYADAMQAEADKRNKAEAAQKRKEIREMLNAPNTFVEREGQHFDDVEGCEVDWRVAPSWAKYWAVRDGGYEALWCVNKPTVTDDCLLSHGGCSPAPSFGFTGSHIMERPHGF